MKKKINEMNVNKMGKKDFFLYFPNRHFTKKK